MSDGIDDILKHLHALIRGVGRTLQTGELDGQLYADWNMAMLAYGDGDEPPAPPAHHGEGPSGGRAAGIYARPEGGVA